MDLPEAYTGEEKPTVRKALSVATRYPLAEGEKTLIVSPEVCMVKKTIFQKVVFVLIAQLPEGTIIRLPEFYQTVKDLLLGGVPPKGSADLAEDWRRMQECALRGDLPNEPRYKNDIRWAIRFARDSGYLRHVGTPRSGEWQRTRFSGGRNE